MGGGSLPGGGRGSLMAEPVSRGDGSLPGGGRGSLMAEPVSRGEGGGSLPG